MSALIALMCSTAFAQQTGATVCSLQNSNLMRCTTDFALSGVIPAPNVTNSLSLVGSPANAISCTNGLEVKNPTTGSSITSVPANVTTPATLTACSDSTSNRYSWHNPPRTQITGSTSTDITLASGATIDFKVSVCLASETTCDCSSTGSTATCTLLSKIVTGATAVVQPTGCNVLPATQTINQNAAPQEITASCTSHATNPTALTYKWYDNAQFTGAILATGQTYSPPTTSIGTRTYYAKIENASQQLGALASGATVNVQTPSGGMSCQQAGIANVVNINYTYRQYSRNLATITGNGVWVLEIVVPAGASSIAASSVPRLALTQLDTNGFANRTMTLSRSCGDFSPGNSVLLASGTTQPKGYLVTADDLNRLTGVGRGVVTAGQTWYLNVRNDDCTASGFATCNFAYTWSNPAGTGAY